MKVYWLGWMESWIALSKDEVADQLIANMACWSCHAYLNFAHLPLVLLFKDLQTRLNRTTGWKDQSSSSPIGGH